MSAYVVSNEHINRILNLSLRINSADRFAKSTYYVYWPDLSKVYGHNIASHQMMSYIGNVLLKENIRSVCHRYSGEESESQTFSFEAESIREPAIVCAAELKSLLGCLEYQSCETRDYHASHAFQWISFFRLQALDALTPGTTY